MWKGAIRTHQHLRTMRCLSDSHASVHGNGVDATHGATVKKQEFLIEDGSGGGSGSGEINTEPPHVDKNIMRQEWRLKRSRDNEGNDDAVAGGGNEKCSPSPLYHVGFVDDNAHACSVKRESPSTEVTTREVIVLDDNTESTTTTITEVLNVSSSKTATPLSYTERPESLLQSDTSAVDASSPQGSSAPSVKLSEEQQHVFDLVVKYGRSVFLTGGAGTGKSHLLRAIIAALPRSSTFVTATTGIAALNLGGSTLHSFACCGLIDSHTHDAADVHRIVCGKSKAKRNWRFCKVLVVDEVSMMDAWFFDVLEYVARKMRGSRYPFGGIQLVLAGDFLQLPPVVKQSGQDPRFCFESEAWCRVNPRVCVLSQRFRQSDEGFFAMLNEMRSGVLTASSLAMLSSISSTSTVLFLQEPSRQIKVEGGADDEKFSQRLSHGDVVDSQGRSKKDRCEGFSILRARRAEVDAVNKERFNELKTEIYSYKGFHCGEGKYPADLPPEVSLRIGCRVMLIKNLDISAGLVNGSVGTVEDFVDIRSVNDLANKTSRGDLRNIATHSKIPVVRFDSSGGGDSSNKGNNGRGRLAMMEPHRWSVLQGDKEVSYSVQIPLQLAYAITIHKSQGMSLARVNVDFKGIFEEGQAYVALSRCTDMNKLIIENFDAHRVNPNAKALAYYKALSEVTKAEEEEEKNLMSAHVHHPWGYYNINDDDDDDDHFYSYSGEIGEDHNKDNISLQEGNKKKNVAVIVESIRRRITPSYVLWSSLRLRVLSSAERASSLHGALLVMDMSSLLALGSSPNCAVLYDNIFVKNQNMMRVPRLVKTELLHTASVREVGVCLTPSVRLSFSSARSPSPSTVCAREAAELAAGTLCVMEDAKKDFVLDEQRDGESRPLPPLLHEWENLPLNVWSGVRGGQSGPVSYQQQVAQLLEFSRYLHEQYSSHQPVLVCTESIELAARALAVGLRVCSLMYLCPKERS